MKYKIIIISFLVIVGFTSCAKAPERETLNNDSGNAGEEIIDDSTAGSENYYVSLEEARKMAEELEGTTYQGIKLPAHINVAEVDKVYTYDNVAHIISLDRLTSFMKQIWNWEETLLSLEPEIIERENDYQVISDNIFYSIVDNGFVFLDGLNVFRGSKINVSETYDLLWGDVIDDSVEYELEDGKMNLNEAVSYVEKEINENFTGFEKGVTGYKVTHVYAGHLGDNDKYVYKFKLSRVFEGMCTETSSYYNSFDSEYFIMGFDIIVFMGYCNSIDVFTTNRETRDFLQTGCFDKIVSPCYAIERLNKEVANVGMEEYEMAGLLYCLVNRNAEYKGEHSDYLPENPIDENGEETEHYVYIKPYWIFTNNFEDVFNGGVDVHRDTVFVDALTGDVFYYSSGTPSSIV